MTLALGPFVLEEPIARGGMAEVWRAVHPARSVLVAVKVLTGESARRRESLAQFRGEVRAAARLTHPGIAMVLDYGEVDGPTARASQGRLAEGSPFLVMEYGRGGALSRVRHPLSWSRLEALLLALLDALAHAHARGVIHRDVKPANVVLCGPQDLRPGPKLTDFGIAHALDLHHVRSEASERAGTLHYMAPEQIRGDWRNHGPWTDLYALGCLAWRLSGGRPPFAGRKDHELSLAQLEDRPPPLQPNRPVPEGFEDWLLRLLEKDHRRRFQCAADAAWALRALDRSFAIVDDDDPEIEALWTHPTETWSEDTLRRAPAADRTLPTLDVRLRREDAPPLPESWRRGPPPRPPLQLVGAGLGLFGLRTIPLVGRHAERSALWGALRAAHRDRGLQIACVSGPAGIGKSRLVEWTCQRAVELGGATVLHAHSGQEDVSGEAVRRMVERFFACTGLDRARVRARVAYVLEGYGAANVYETEGLVELIAPAPADGPAPAVRLASAAERYAVVARLLERIAAVRPVILRFEDVQWGADALGLVRFLVARRRSEGLPALILLTARDESLATRPREAAELERLLKTPGAVRIPLAPLGKRERQVLVEELLGLEGPLAAEVEERTGGNPLFAVQLVGDWVQRGVLELRPYGFGLRDGEIGVLPDDLHAVWAARIDQALEGLPDGSRLALERAAALGQRVEGADWREVCGDLPAGICDRVQDRLLGLRLALPTSTGWAFAHGMLRESLERAAREAGRSVEHHLAAARMLEARGSGIGVDERLGRHLLAAGRRDEAVEPLLAGVAERERTVGFADALALLNLVEDAMDEGDPRRLGVWVDRARLLRFNGDLDQALDLAQRVLSLAEAAGLEEIRRAALSQKVQVLRMRWGVDRVAPLVDEMVQIARASGDKRLLATSLYELALVEHARHDTTADRRVEEAGRLYEELGDEHGWATCECRLADHEKDRGRLDEARARYVRVLAIYERMGLRSRIAYAANGLGEVERLSGDLDAAQAQYERAQELFDALGGVNVVVPRVNLGLLAVSRGHYREARSILDNARLMAETMGMRPFLVLVHAALLPCVGTAGDWALWDVHLAQASDLFAESGEADRDVADCVLRGARIADAAGERTRAETAWRLALVLCRALGLADRVAEAEARLG